MLQNEQYLKQIHSLNTNLDQVLGRLDHVRPTPEDSMTIVILIANVDSIVKEFSGLVKEFSGLVYEITTASRIQPRGPSDHVVVLAVESLQFRFVNTQTKLNNLVNELNQVVQPIFTLS